MSNYICNRDQGCTTTENNTINVAKIIQMSKSLSAEHSASVCICYISGRDAFGSQDSTLSIQEGFHIVCKATFTSEITVEQMWRCTPGRVKTPVSSPVRGRANEWAHKGSTMENLPLRTSCWVELRSDGVSHYGSGTVSAWTPQKPSRGKFTCSQYIWETS